MARLKAGTLVLLFALGCKQGDESRGGERAGPPKTASSEATSEAANPGTAATGLRQVEAPPPPKLHDEPVERRLHSDRIEASSFLWTDWNKFQENYHPNYILDGDPATAWVEGADGSGVGEWVRIHVSPVEGATKIRLRLRNGYHKSKALHDKNARLEKVELVALPSGAKHVTEVADTMDWQELVFEQPAGKLEAIELRAVEVVDGSKYTDLCVSDVELFVTGLTVENPAFEKSKHDALLAWKDKRLEAAKLLSSASADELPILFGYRVTPGEKVSLDALQDGKPHPELRAMLAALAKHAPPASYADAAKRATAALEQDFAGWVKAKVVARAPLTLPEVDGLRVADDEELVYGGPYDAFLAPEANPMQGSLLRSGQLSMFDVKGDNPMNDFACEAGENAFMRPPRSTDDGPVVRELLHVKCITEETRDGEGTYMTWQLLEYDANGNLVLAAGPDAQAQWFEWHDGERTVLAGGGRLRPHDDELQRLVAAAPMVAKK